MPYCINCGVKLNHKENNCPLCRREVEHIDINREQEFPYPHSVFKLRLIKSGGSRKEIIILSLSGFLALLVILLTLGIDYTVGRNISWSIYSSLSIIYIYLSLMVLINLRYSPIISYTMLNLLLGLYLYLIDSVAPGEEWFLSYGLPSLLYLQAGAVVAFILIRLTRSKLIKGISILITLCLYLILINYIIQKEISWSLISTSVLLPTSLFLTALRFLLGKAEDYR